MFKKLIGDVADKFRGLADKVKIWIDEWNSLLNLRLDLQRAPRIVFSHKVCQKYAVVVIERVDARPILYCRHCGREVNGEEVLCFILSAKDVNDGSFPYALRISA